jgi:hypothetical protein
MRGCQRPVDHTVCSASELRLQPCSCSPKSADALDGPGGPCWRHERPALPSWPGALAFPLMNWNDPSGGSSRPGSWRACAGSSAGSGPHFRLALNRQRDNDQPGQAPSADARKAGRARRHPGTQRVAGSGRGVACGHRAGGTLAGTWSGLPRWRGPVSPAGRSRPVRPCLARDRACVSPDRTFSPRRPGPAGRPAQGPRSGSDAQRPGAGTGPRSRAGRSR